MRILAYEYLSTGAMPDAESLAREGLAMLAAVTADLAACPGVEVVTMVAPRLLGVVGRHGVESHLLEPGREEATFRQLARGCDAALLVAPEFDDLLARRAEWASDEGCRLLGPSPLGIRLAADKLGMATRWERHGIPTPPTLHYTGESCPFAYPVVVKPRFGAGALTTFRIDHDGDYTHPASLNLEHLIVQPFVPGVAASIAFLVGTEATVALLPAVQHLDLDRGAIHYRGGRMPQVIDPTTIELTRRAVAAVPGLQGYVGVDLVASESPQVIEINPRLTTSYIGLRKLARFNVMRAMLDVLEGRTVPTLDYHPGEVTFHPDYSGE